ncbi:hypothetical protein FTO70_06165 [Methanosarcina sp. KYL-1]|uniref:hypothetical protein n=1 Tax=Methanosarcina sp. KYL-1 TaxID=2602068 RepID=UPI00210133CB|nr:hypothetical protein [Methanosarcina sp. KYL-1]MCQ1535281.1 hypothetical protein [Methanosarcina sp. KYL-1]
MENSGIMVLFLNICNWVLHHIKVSVFGGRFDEGIRGSFFQEEIYKDPRKDEKYRKKRWNPSLKYINGKI